MEPSSTANYKTVRGLTRGLTVLNALNRELVGATPSRLSELTGIHRTTVRRLLETLQSEGYVRRSPSDDSYRLTMKVRELSEGFRDDHWISAVAAPLLGELLNEVLWPTDLTTLEADAMVVRETTHRFSRLSFHRSMVGRRLPLLETASGLAYLAFCPEKERNELIQLLARQQGREGEIARDTKALNNLLLRTQRKGFGENYQDWDLEQRIASIAIPIRSGDEVLACLNLVYIAEAMTIDDAAAKYLPAMNRTRAKIEEALTNPD
ncbi:MULTISPECIES: DNA-binding transcriptional regulator [Marinobacter]|uniref:DNA-binding transcriptional regulator n=1 Tax=Marinobacter TaxID=2742 RepID=UPI000C3B4261|nr:MULTISPECIES: DNA-binding transcriptional regulator [Marinobacter]MAO12150.1 transcriptional regulator [Marinobacter sp.]BEH12979.1 transcriptional regulator [Marinobacter shengliensis]